jgi:pimeloyl-ACP methyl ester carboxylesterase
MVRHKVRTTLLVLSALVVVVLLAGVVWQSAEANRAQNPFPGRLVTADGLHLQLYCTGRGDPTVVLDSGLGETLVDWQLVQPVIAKRTTVCSYNRAGLGASSSDSGTRDAHGMADQLFALLTRAAVPRPYVLVGHSLGGLTMRVFAGLHRAQVAGLALIDSASPTDATALPPQVSAQQRAQFAPADLCSSVSTIDRLRRSIGLDRLTFTDTSTDRRLPARWQAVQRADARRWINGHSAPCAEGYAENAALPASDREAAKISSLGALPLAVVSRGLAETWPPPVPVAQTEAAWRSEQAMLTHLSTRTRWTTAHLARHYIMLDQPSAVIDAISWLLEQPR